MEGAMIRESDLLSATLVTLGRSLQQDFAPVLSPRDDIPRGVSWAELPALDGVAADWAAITTITTITDILSTFYGWLTTDLLGAEAPEPRDFGNLPLPSAAAQPSPRQPQIPLLAETYADLSGNHFHEETTSQITPLSSGSLEDPRLPMAEDNSQTPTNRYVADDPPRRTPLISMRPSADSGSPSDGGASRSRFFPPDTLQSSAMASRSTSTKAPIVGGLADLAAQLTTLDGINPVQIEPWHSPHPKSISHGEMDFERDSFRITSPMGRRARGESQNDTFQQGFGLAPEAQARLSVPDISGQGDFAPTMRRSGNWDLPHAHLENNHLEVSNDMSSSGQGGQARSAARASAAAAPIVGGFVDFAAQITKRAEHPASSNQDLPYPAPMAMDNTARIHRVEVLPWSEPNALTPMDKPSNALPLVHPMTSAREVRFQSAPADGVRSSPPETSVAWAEPRSPDRSNLEDLEDLMTAITNAISRDYQRFYGP